jgi:hypothetical protein
MHLGLKKILGTQKLSGLKNTSLSVLDAKDGQFSLEAYNQTSYLKNQNPAGNTTLL